MVPTRKRKANNEGSSIQASVKRTKQENVSLEHIKRENKENEIKPVKKKQAFLQQDLPKLKVVIKKEEMPTTEDSMSSDEEVVETSAASLADKMKANLMQNAKFFAELDISAAKAQVLEVASTSTTKASQKGYKEKKEKEVLPRRKSMRLQNLTPLGIQLPERQLGDLFVDEDRYKRIVGDVEMKENLTNDNDDGSHDKFLSSLGKLRHSPAKPSPDLEKFLKETSKMCLQQVAKVTNDRVFSVALHPTESKVLAFAGDKNGKIGFWDVGSSANQDGVFCYEPHSRPVKQLTVFPSRPLQLFSCAYDGQLRCCHLERALFEEVYSNDVPVTGFDFHDDHVMLVSQYHGTLARVDLRTARSEATEYKIHVKHTRSVSINPSDKNYFATAHQDGTVFLWDLRSMGRKSKCVQQIPHNRVVETALFSPTTGQKLITTGLDNTIRIYSSEKIGAADLTLQKCIRHDNFTGRWLSKFRAVWHPSREDVFVVGSMARPRRIELYSDSGSLVKEFSDAEQLSTICSLNAWHPTRNILVGGNSSGRLHVFM